MSLTDAERALLRGLGQGQYVAAVERILAAREAPEVSSQTISSKRAAEIFGVHPNTIWNWCRSGRLPHEVTPGGQRRLRLADVLALKAEMDEQRKASAGR